MNLISGITFQQCTPHPQGYIVCEEIKPNARLLRSDFTLFKYKCPEISYNCTYNFVC